MGWLRVPYRDRGYMRHAGLQNIEAHLSSARANLRRAQRQLRWLELLHALRAQQNEVGDWPRLANDESAGGTAYWDGLWDQLEVKLRSDRP